MLKGLKLKEERASPWYLYILECRDGTLYTGITNDLKRRFDTHNKARGARYTRTRLPVKLVYSEILASRSAALIRECAVKALPKPKKLRLIEGNCQNPPTMLG